MTTPTPQVSNECCEKCVHSRPNPMMGVYQGYCNNPACPCHQQAAQEKGCICEDDNKLTQAFCPIHGAPAYRAAHAETRGGWEAEFDREFPQFFGVGAPYPI